jgi:hypothetical protein
MTMIKRPGIHVVEECSEKLILQTYSRKTTRTRDSIVEKRQT